MYDYQLDPQVKQVSSFENLSTEELYQKLVKLDEKAIGKIDEHNRRRIINAILYYQEHGTSITENKTNNLLYDAIFIGLTTERAQLYQIINQRVDKMIQAGLLKEVEAFYQRKIRTKPLIGGIGYKELYAYFDKKISLEEAISDIKRDSRRYAKRQYTFFNHQLPVVWFQTNYDDFQKTVEQVCAYIDYLK